MKRRTRHEREMRRNAIRATCGIALFFALSAWFCRCAVWALEVTAW